MKLNQQATNLKKLFLLGIKYGLNIDVITSCLKLYFISFNVIVKELIANVVVNLVSNRIDRNN